MKLPRGYKLTVPFPPYSGSLILTRNGETIREFPYATSDATIERLASLHNRFGIFAEK